MRKLRVFNQVSLDGYFVNAKGEMRWAHKSDPEWNEFVAGNAGSGGELLFGRVTYEMMAGYWPTPIAAKNDPMVAERMNGMPKIVFSRSLDQASWQNTRLVKEDLAGEVRRMKNGTGGDIAILGSGSIVAQLAQEGLIDEYQIVVNPIVLGRGRTLLEGVSKRLTLKLTSSRAFSNGNVVLLYEPAG